MALISPVGYLWCTHYTSLLGPPPYACLRAAPTAAFANHKWPDNPRWDRDGQWAAASLLSSLPDCSVLPEMAVCDDTRQVS